MAAVAALAEQLARAVGARDFETARRLHAALGGLIDAAAAAPAGVVDLEAARARKR